MGAYARQRAKDRIAELAGRGLDLVTFWQECSEVISPVVPFYLTPCFYTLDPASLLVTSHYHDGLPEIPHEWLALEYYADDVVRHEAPYDRAEMKGLRRGPVAAGS